jgi:hypothetical protein
MRWTSVLLLTGAADSCRDEEVNADPARRTTPADCVLVSLVIKNKTATPSSSAEVMTIQKFLLSPGMAQS